MTCIVGIEHGGKVHLGADSAGVSGWALTLRADEKVFTRGKFILGFTSSFRMGQLLRYKLAVAGQPEEMDTTEYMTTWFIDAVRSTLKTGGYAEIDKGRETGGTFLVGYRGALYNVASDFQVGRSVNGFDAVGCGADLALGALHATPTLSPQKRIDIALEAAERFSAGVRGPFLALDAS